MCLQPKLPQRTPRSELSAYGRKTRKFVEAISRLPLSRRFSLNDPQAAGDYDAIVVGSDEVWNFRHPWYGSKPIFFGDGLQTERLVSYAASFGNHSAWDGIHPEWARKLSRFSAISVRDENSRELVNGGTDREPPIPRPMPSIPRADLRRRWRIGGGLCSGLWPLVPRLAEAQRPRLG
jgi:hypothetical protein